MKKITALILTIILCVSLSACGEATVPQASYDELQTQYSELQSQNDTLKKESSSLNNQLEKANSSITELEKRIEEKESIISELEAKIDDLENGPAALIVSIRNASESEEWENVIHLADDLHTKANGSPEDVEGQKLAAAAQKAIEKAEALQAAEEAKGYETGITYDQLTRNPDDYKGEKVTFKGTVFQSTLEGNNTIIMIFVDGNYNHPLYITIPSASITSRVIENDRITVRGLANGLFTYDSSGRGRVSVPWVKADTIER